MAQRTNSESQTLDCFWSARTFFSSIQQTRNPTSAADSVCKGEGTIDLISWVQERFWVQWNFLRIFAHPTMKSLNCPLPFIQKLSFFYGNMSHWWYIFERVRGVCVHTCQCVYVCTCMYVCGLIYILHVHTHTYACIHNTYCCKCGCGIKFTLWAHDFSINLAAQHFFY